MIRTYQHVKTSIETLDAKQNFKLYLTYYEGGKKPLLLGMHLGYRDIYMTETSQISNHIRSVFRKFGNEFLRKIAPNDYFSIEQRSIEKETYKSLLCKFIKSEKIYTDVIEAHAMTQAWDQLLFQYDLSKLFSSGQTLLTTQGPDRLLQRMTDSRSDIEDFAPLLPPEINNFLKIIVEMEQV